MRIAVLALVSMLLAARAVASPQPPPPADFTATQYIDGAGCVFERAGDAWQARVDTDGAPVCGFPPSLSARGSGVAVTTAAQEDPPSVEQRLNQQLAQGLRDGEFRADPAPREQRLDPPQQPQSPMLDMIAVMMRQQAGLMAGGEAARLCALLGYRPEPTGLVPPGADVTQGYCPAMRAEVPRPLAVAPNPVTDPVRALPRPSPQKPGASSATARRQAATPPRREPAVEMIPASARYVEIGSYADDSNANSAIRTLSQRGYPVGQSRARRQDGTVRVILAGPFADRQSLVAALNDLRRNGYPRARPR